MEFDSDMVWLFVMMLVVLGGVGFIAWKANKEQSNSPDNKI